MWCRVCECEDTYELLDIYEYRWWRCVGCGSDTSDCVFRAELYAEAEADYLHRTLGSIEAAVAAMQTNLDWFTSRRSPPGTFLDVGTNEGAALVGMRQAGWNVTGFDVNPYSVAEVIAPKFTAGLFGSQFDCVLCREVIEHVPDWQDMLRELAAVTAPDGLLQIQTPRPLADVHDEMNRITYSPGHLQVFTPYVMRQSLLGVGLEIVDAMLWHGGQAWMCSKP